MVSKSWTSCSAEAKGVKREDYTPYLLLLDIRIPKIDGVEVLRQIKQDEELRKIPVIMLTTTDDPRGSRRLSSLGMQPLHRKARRVRQVFGERLSRLGLFLKIVQVPQINGVR